MAKKLSKEELRKLASDFDPPAAPETHHGDAPPLRGEKRVRVTGSLTREQYGMLKRLSKKSGLPMSRLLGEAVEALCKKPSP